MFGWILNTLSYQISRELKQWHKTNSVYIKRKWDLPKRFLISASRHPVLYPLALSILALSFSGVVWLFFRVNNVLLALFSIQPVLKVTNVEQPFFSLWTIQAAITGLIYPIVISFVTLLLQRRHTAKVSLHIYFHESAALLTGLGTLFLVITMGVQFLFFRAADGKTMAWWIGIDAFWFLGNIAGVIWFLVRTFDYLRPESRAQIIRSYALNLA